ncbi:hypothetical protein NDU88_006948 [Pleurodeles waltl]|uniref:Uncharacterized protein n=1 Tax=Pleurodeles waltl TaxID=8319 RepID=A0AAV7U1K6_PLEWA|nr:hypothetical protein NDU88_006948 [Pleurodeles waltl]
MSAPSARQPSSGTSSALSGADTGPRGVPDLLCKRDAGRGRGSSLTLRSRAGRDVDTAWLLSVGRGWLAVPGRDPIPCSRLKRGALGSRSLASTSGAALRDGHARR